MPRTTTSHLLPASSPLSMPSLSLDSPLAGHHSLLDNNNNNNNNNNNSIPVPTRAESDTSLAESSSTPETAGKLGQSSSESSLDEAEDDDDEDDVFSPADAASLLEQALISDDCLLAGPNKRTFDDADLGDALLMDVLDFGLPDDELDYPRKKMPKRISANIQGILAYSNPLFMNDDKVKDDDDEDDDEDNETIDDDDDGNITDEEEAAIMREFGSDNDDLLDVGHFDVHSLGALPVDLDVGAIDFDGVNSLFDDLDGEIFDAMCNDPHRFDDLQGQNSYDWNPFTAESDHDLFSVHPTPAASPDSTPRASVSAQLGQPFRSQRSSVTSEDEASEEDEGPHLNPFFEMDNATLKHLVSTEGKGGWSDETDDDADLLKYFFSSADDDSGEDTERADNDDTDDDDDEALTDDGDTTDEEEDLPMPLPQTASKLRRASVSATGRPQIVDTNHEGPELCSWVADPSRPICVIEGKKQTFLIPDAYKRFSIGGDSDGSQTPWIPMEALEESESEQSTFPPFDPTLDGFAGIEGPNTSDALGPSEAFYPFMSDAGDIFSDLFNEEDYDVDEFEAGLEIDDFLDLSSEEEEGTNEAGKDRQHTEGLSDDFGEEGEEEEDECVPNGDASADMLSIWDKVSVTAFRKRQIQHSQKLTLNANHYSGGQGYNKGKEGRLSETITPTKKRRVRQKFLASNRGGLGNNPGSRKKLAR